MIYGEIRELKFYKGMSKYLDKAIEMIESGVYKEGDPGKNIIDGDNFYFNYETAKTENIDERFFEGHKNYIDIHIIISGKEKIGYSPRSNVVRTLPWDRAKDFEKYEGAVYHIFEMEEDKFIIFFPEEPHMPLIKSGENCEEITKAVFKIKDKKY